MIHGGTCMTVSFLGAARVIGQYKMMGPVKAALESAVRYAAVEPGPKSISVHALSPELLKTRAASGLASFDALVGDAASQAPTRHLVTIEDVGAYAAFRGSQEAWNVTGAVHQIGGGYNIVG